MTRCLPYISTCHTLRSAAVEAALCGMLLLSTCLTPSPLAAQSLPAGADPRSIAVYDCEVAREICDLLPLDHLEGIWIYPEDNVTVLIRRRQDISPSALPEYALMVVATSDVSLHPGEEIGVMKASPDEGKFNISLFTERKNGLLLKPVTCSARLDKNGETLTFRQTNKKFRFRFTFNPSLILPKFWRVVRFNSGTSHEQNDTPPYGMVKIYPSYDGNGSSRRQPRYL